MNNNKYVGKTHLQVLKELAEKNTCDEFEEKLIKYWCIVAGLKNAVVTCGMIYPQGRGQAFSCNAFAKELLKQISEVL
jgi:hypothetical protein